MSKYSWEWEDNLLIYSSDRDDLTTKCYLFYEKNSMLPKYPKPLYRKILIKSATALFVVEAVGFACSYGVWYKLNTERDFRFYMRNNFPKVLELYYTLDDKFGNSNIRVTDSDYWKKTSS